ncbi:MAG: isoprenylcysteine carboxylmethyltransferase family protein [Anaerolineales bacterium]|jgi:protein-S-isoprenylcysteine O-methyltransferase Ste14
MTINLKLLVAETVGIFTIFGLALFLPAGTLAWPAGWIWLLLFFSFFVGVQIWLYRHDPGLLQERLHLGTSDQQSWDKALFTLTESILIAWLVFSSLDGGRFHWSALPVGLQAVGGLLLLSSFCLLFLTFRENSYASVAVRVQSERGQTVISTGPYRHIRHPMYSAILIFVLGTTLLLGSAYGLILGLIAVALFGRRAVLEERMLVKQLPGYAEYESRVRYRFIPHVW